MSRRIEIELHDPYIKVLSTWASVSRTLRTAEHGCEQAVKLALLNEELSAADMFAVCRDELNALTPALDHLHHAARQELWENRNPGYIKDGLDTRVALYLEGSWRAPKVSQLATTRVFLLLNGKFVVCEKCALTADLVASKAVAYFAINVVPYSQKCHQCRQDIVRGWITQLFDNPRDRA